MMSDYIIPLDEVVYDVRAKDGSWCTLPYPNHPKGCPNFPDCITHFRDFKELEDRFKWYAVIEKFDLAAHAEKMKEKHPNWTERQCRNLLYWQNKVRKRLRDKAYKFHGLGDCVLEIPEACGVNVFATMKKVGVHIESPKPMTVTKIMLVGKRPIDETKLRKN